MIKVIYRFINERSRNYTFKIKVNNTILDIYKMLIYTCTFLNTLPELVLESYNHAHVCTRILTQPLLSGKVGYQHIHRSWGCGFSC